MELPMVHIFDQAEHSTESCYSSCPLGLYCLLRPFSRKSYDHYCTWTIFRILARLHEVQKSFCSHPGRTRSRSFSRSRSTLLKFSRSLYLDNQLSESIHTWTIGTLKGLLSFHDIGPQGPCQGVGLEVKN